MAPDMAVRPAAMDGETFEAFRTELRRFVRDRLVPAERDVIDRDRIDDQLLNEMRDFGLFALTAPSEFGGIGMNVSEYIETIYELAWAAPAFRSIISLNTGMLTSALVNGGTEAQKREWLPRLCNGTIGCFAMTEPDSGSDAAGLRTRAVRDGERYVLNGTKRYITNAPVAEVVLVMARTNIEHLPRNAHVSAFLVPVDTSGLSVGGPDKKMGQEGAQIADITFDNVEVPAANLLGGEEGKGFAAAMGALDLGRLSVAAASMGYSERMLDVALRYATERTAFGEPIAGFQLIQAMLADSRADIYAGTSMLRDACHKADRGERFSLEAACAKMFASEACGRVADRTVQIHGGAGYLREYDAERFYRDARIYRIYEGTTQIQQLVIAKNMLRDFMAAER
jgi:acyl-CoA dehydrogenase